MKDSLTNESPVRVAVYGVGSMGNNHARILSSLPGAELAGVIDLDRKKAEDIAEKYSTRVLEGENALDEVDGVVVAVPTCHHLQTVIPILESGKGVLCEKPMAATYEECQAMVDASEKSGAPLLVGHVEHFNPGVEALALQVSEPGFMEIHRLGVFTPRSLDVDVVLDLMIHDIEIAMDLAGKELEKVEAVGVSVLTDFVDIANARLTFSGGCVANLTASRISKEKVRKLRVFQHRAYLAVDYAEQSVEHYELKDDGDGRRIERMPVNVQNEEPLRNELRHFVNVIRGVEAPKVSGKTAGEAVAVAEKILKCMKR